MAHSLNLATVQSANGLIAAAGTGLSTALEGMVQLVIWMIRMYTKTLKCVIELVVNGSVAALEDAARLVQGLLHETARAVAAHTDSLTKGINDAKRAIPFASNFIPNVAIPSLKDVPMPDLVAGVRQLSKHLPTFQELEAQLVALIEDPVDRISKSIEKSAKAGQLEFSMLPLPEKGEASLCVGVDLSAVDHVTENVVRTSWLLLGLAGLFIMMLIVANVVAIRYHHWKLDRRIVREAFTEELLEQEFQEEEKNAIAMQGLDSQPDPSISRRRAIERHHVYLKPTLNRFTIQSSRILFRSRTNRFLWRWYIDYILYRPALICASIGLAGILVVVLQRAAITSFREHQPTLAKMTHDLGYEAGTTINDRFGVLTKDLLASTNEILAAKEEEFNRRIFDSFKETGSVLDETLDTAINGITSTVDALFGSSKMAQPAKKCAHCLVTSRLRSMQQAIEWITKKSHLSIPRVPATALQADEESIHNLAQHISVELFGPETTDTEDDDGGYVGRALDSYVNSLHKENAFYILLLGGYIALMVFGAVRVIMVKYRIYRN